MQYWNGFEWFIIMNTLCQACLEHCFKYNAFLITENSSKKFDTLEEPFDSDTAYIGEHALWIVNEKAY